MHFMQPDRASLYSIQLCCQLQEKSQASFYDYKLALNAGQYERSILSRCKTTLTTAQTKIERHIVVETSSWLTCGSTNIGDTITATRVKKDHYLQNFIQGVISFYFCSFLYRCDKNSNFFVVVEPSVVDRQFSTMKGPHLPNKAVITAVIEY